MKVQTIASGSKGNCTIVLGSSANLIIDMGISYRTLKKVLEENSLSFTDFSAILITHCHKDHTSGLSSLLSHTKLKVFISEKMYDSLKEIVPYTSCNFIDQDFAINDINIKLLPTTHDAPSSTGFLIKEENRSLVYITDTGYINRKILNKIVNVNCYIIESNHDEVMLMDGPYPRFLKERVISDKGHLSNKTTAKYLSKIVGPNTKNIILAHRSETNNTEEKIKEAIEEVNLREDINVIIAKQNEPSPLIEI